MREIRFRGKRIDTGEWVYGYLCFMYIDTPYKSSIYDPKAVRSYDVLSSTVGQYTGLHDKNGKEIYEGDVLKWDEKEWGCPFNEVAEWDFSLFSIRKHDWAEWCEVIGNKHENKELLKCETEAD